MADRDHLVHGASDSTSDGRRLKLAALVVAAVLAVVASLVLARHLLADGGDASDGTTSVFLDNPHHDAGAATSGAGDDAIPPASRTAGNRLSRCAAADRYLAGALGHARPALDQWAVHVGAMNELAAGEITIEQARAFWSSTRVGASRRVGEFRDVMSDLRARGIDCPSAHYLGPGSRVLPGCVQRVSAEVSALDAARTAMRTWEHHIHDMEMLRTGRLSFEDATDKWLSMWQEGSRDLAVYDAAVQRVEQQGACSRRASSQ